MLKLRSGLMGMLSLMLLAACGGGGGATGGGNDNSWLSVTPSTVTVTTIAGAVAPFELTATSSKTISQTLYPVLIDKGGVINPAATVITAINAYSYKATLVTSKTLPQGSHRGNIELWLYTDPLHSSAYPGSPWIIPYQINVGPVRVAHKLLPKLVGVAFSSTPGGSRLTQSIDIADNLGKTTTWQAVSDQAWLQVTATGTTGTPGSALTLTADPTTLPSDTTSYATVTLSSSDTTVLPIQQIKVGCWKGTNSAQRADVSVIFPGPGSGDHTYSDVCVDPIRPLAYFSYGNQVYGGNSGNVIDCYNLYTATKIWSLTLPDIIGNGGSMAVASDGSALYVVDFAGYDSGIYKIPLTDSTPGEPVRIASTLGNFGLMYARPNGVGVILTSDGRAFLASMGSALSATGFEGSLAATADSETMYVGNGYAGSGFASRHAMDFSEFAGGTLVTRLLNTNGGTYGGSFGRPIAVSREGARLYWLSPTAGSEGMTRLNPLTLSALGQFPNPFEYTGLRIANDGRLIASVQNRSDLSHGLRVFGPDDTLLSTLDAGSPASSDSFASSGGAFNVSSDSMVVVVNSRGVLHFFPIYP